MIFFFDLHAQDGRRGLAQRQRSATGRHLHPSAAQHLIDAGARVGIEAQ